MSMSRRPPASDAEHLIAGLEPSVFLVHEFIDKNRPEAGVCNMCGVQDFLT